MKVILHYRYFIFYYLFSPFFYHFEFFVLPIWILLILQDSGWAEPILYVGGQDQSSCLQQVQLCRHWSSVLVDRIKAATLYRYSCVDIDPLYKGTGSKQHLTTGTVVRTLILFIRGQDLSSCSQQVQLCRHWSSILGDKIKAAAFYR